MTFTKPTPQSLRTSIAGKLTPVADRLRDLHAKFGLRPYRVFLVHLRWSGGERNLGVPEVLSEVEILPVPHISSLEGLELTLQTGGLDEVGGILVREISGTFTENQLAGGFSGGTPLELPQDVSFAWEVQYFRAGDASRRRFALRSAPFYDAPNLQWTVRLIRTTPDRLPDGTPEG